MIKRYYKYILTIGVSIIFVLSVKYLIAPKAAAYLLENDGMDMFFLVTGVLFLIWGSLVVFSRRFLELMYRVFWGRGPFPDSLVKDRWDYYKFRGVGSMVVGFMMLYMAHLSFLDNRCNLAYQQSIFQSEHNILEDVFWNGREETCFLITRRPYWGNGSDWAIDYVKKNNLNDWDLIEAEEYMLLDTNKKATVLDKIYSYQNLQEYLANPNKYPEWKADFFKRTSIYR